MKGSWAGAMGQPQFMPSSYLQFAQDFDGDGRRDIWTTPDDVFASIANYLKGHGWNEGQTWGREVSIPKEAATRIAGDVGRREGTCRATRDMTVALPLGEVAVARRAQPRRRRAAEGGHRGQPGVGHVRATSSSIETTTRCSDTTAPTRTP